MSSKIDWTRPIRHKLTKLPCRLICSDRKTTQTELYVILYTPALGLAEVVVYVDAEGRTSGFQVIENVPQEYVRYAHFCQFGNDPNHVGVLLLERDATNEPQKLQPWKLVQGSEIKVLRYEH